jgi:tetratricopeptide (TPR) repeat protein
MLRPKLFTPLVFFLLLAAGFAQTASMGPTTSQIQSALRTGEFAQALQLSDAALKTSPSNATLWTMKGIALSRLGREKDALVAYDRALSISPEYLAALEGAAEIEYKAGNARAVPLLNRILKLRPDDPTSHAMLGVLAYKQRDCTSTVKHFRASREVIDSQPAALAQYGSCLMDLQQAGDAVAVFQQIKSLQPDDPHAQYNLAVAQLIANLAKEAIATLQPLLRASGPEPDVLDLASSAYEETGDTPQAVKLLRQAIIADPKNSKYYVDFAAISFNHQSFQVGVDMINAGLQQVPKPAPLYVARGILYVQLGQFDKAEADFANAMRIDPSQTSGAVAQGLALVQQSNLDQALATVRSELKAHPTDAFLQYMQAQILSQQGAEPDTAQFKEAVASAVLSTQINPDFVLARDLLGNLYLKAGAVEKSIQESRRALQLSPSDQEALYHLIQALRKSGKDTKGELPGLVKHLAELRKEARSAEVTRYRLYEPEKQSGEVPQTK